jgi:hypothetical protein
MASRHIRHLLSIHSFSPTILSTYVAGPQPSQFDPHRWEPPAALGTQAELCLGCAVMAGNNDESSLLHLHVCKVGRIAQAFQFEFDADRSVTFNLRLKHYLYGCPVYKRCAVHADRKKWRRNCYFPYYLYRPHVASPPP